MSDETPNPSGPGPAAPSSSPGRPLDAAGRRLAREAARERKRERDRERQAAKRAAERELEGSQLAAASSSSSPAPALGPALPERTDEHRAEDAAVFLRFFYRVAHFVAGWFGYLVEPLSVEDSKADALLLVEPARRWLWFDRVLMLARYATALERFGKHLKPKPKPETAAGAAGEGAMVHHIGNGGRAP